MKLHIKFLFVINLFVSTSVFAGLVPKSHIGFAGIDFQSNAELILGNDSNVTYQSDDKDKISSDYYQFLPEFKMIGERGEDRYLFMYQGDYRSYQSSPADNYTDHRFLANGSWRFGLRHGLQLNLVQDFGHEDRGTELTEGFKNRQFEAYGFNSVMSIKNTDSSVRYNFGAPDGRGKLSLMAQLKTFRYEDLKRIKNPLLISYDDNESLLEYAKKEEWNESTYLIELFDQVSRVSRFRYTVLTNQRRYINASYKDNNEYYAIYGIKTQRTGKTLVDANIAWLYKDFLHKEGNEKNFSGINWDVFIEWKPRDYSSFAISTSQQVKDPDEAGGYILVTNYGLSWSHAWWVDRFSTSLSYEYQNENYKNLSYKRKKDIKTVSFGIHYDFRPSISLGLKFNKIIYDSSPDKIDFNHAPIGLRDLDYDKSKIFATLKVQI